jgi:hypothetical protein
MFRGFFGATAGMNKVFRRGIACSQSSPDHRPDDENALLLGAGDAEQQETFECGMSGGAVPFSAVVRLWTSGSGQ